MRLKGGAACLFSVAVVGGCPGEGQALARPDLVAKVAAGELTEAHAAWWGFSETDSTSALQSAIDSGVRKLVVDNVGKPWIVRPLFGRSDLEIEFEKGVELLAKRGEFHRVNDCLFACRGISNVVLRGYGATFRMHVGDYTNAALYAKSEWRHAIGLWGVSDFRIEGLKLLASGGDGVYFGTLGPGLHCRNGVVRDVVSEYNNRQGMSVISAENLLVERCACRYTSGARPMAGVDIEPNRNTDVLKDIVFRKCVAEGNRGCGFEIEIFAMDASSEPVSIRFEDCLSRGNVRGCRIMRPTNPLRGFPGSYVFERCRFLDEGQDASAFVPDGDPVSSVSAEFRDCTRLDPKDSAKTVPIVGGWRRGEWPRDRQGRALRQIKMSDKVMKWAQVVDRKPGEAVPTSPLAFRGRNVFWFHAARPGKVEWHGRMRLPGGRKAAKGAGSLGTVISSPDGSFVREVGVDFDGDFNGRFSVELPEAGFYTLEIKPRSFNVLWTFTDTPVPLAVVAGRGSREPSLATFPGDLWFAAPKGCSDFALCLSGGGCGENVSARICSPDGKTAWSAENVGESACYRPAGDVRVPGLWKVELRRPTKGSLDDFSLDVIGMPLHFFLTPEKCWTW